MSRSPKLLAPGAAPPPDMRQPFPDKRVQWHENQGHAPGASLRGDHVDKHGLLKRDAPPPRTDLGFAQPRGVRLVSVPDPRSVPGGPRTIGDEFRDLKDQLSAALKRIAALERGAGVETPPEPVAAAPEPEDEAGDQRWDAPDLSPQQRIDAAMNASRAAMNRGAIRTRR